MGRALGDKVITSAHNPKIKLVRDLLGRPRDRRAAGAFAAEGVRLVEEALESGWPIRFALAADGLDGRAGALAARLEEAGVEVERIPAGLLDSLSGTETSQGLLAVLELRPLAWPARPDFVLIADQVRDPGNLGTLLRAAAAAGAQGVLLTPGTADAFAPKVVRAGMGAHFRLPVRETDWDELPALTTGLRVWLAEMAGTSCWEADLRAPLALVVGGEAEGAGPQMRALAGGTLRVPMPGGSESLNAAMAGSILLFEVVRQRQENRE